MSDFSVPDRGLPHYGFPDVGFPLQRATDAYDLVTALLAAIVDNTGKRNGPADAALAEWTGAHADEFRQARAQWLDGHALAPTLEALQGRLLAALLSYQDLQRDVIIKRQRALNADRDT